MFLVDRVPREYVHSDERGAVDDQAAVRGDSPSSTIEGHLRPIDEELDDRPQLVGCLFSKAPFHIHHHRTDPANAVDDLLPRDPEFLGPVVEFVVFMDIDARAISWTSLRLVVGHGWPPAAKACIAHATRNPLKSHPARLGSWSHPTKGRADPASRGMQSASMTGDASRPETGSTVAPYLRCATLPLAATIPRSTARSKTVFGQSFEMPFRSTCSVVRWPQSGHR
jgi:hypothetical protein